jgi:hypothetical protein
MDPMEIRGDSPQEDEFALLALGARSPYEALLVPQRLGQALALSDLLNLAPEEQCQWREVFVHFMLRVSAYGYGRPVILKSPPHGYRVAALRELLPDARFIVVVREPYSTFESAVRMWRTMMNLYTLTPMIPENAIREAVLVDRPRFERKLAEGVAGLPRNRLAVVTYEELIANPVGVMEELYGRIEIGGFDRVRAAIVRETDHRKDYRARATPPSEVWRSRIRTAWASVFDRYDEACAASAGRLPELSVDPKSGG